MVCPRNAFTLNAGGRRPTETPDLRAIVWRACRSATQVQLQTCSSEASPQTHEHVGKVSRSADGRSDSGRCSLCGAKPRSLVAQGGGGHRLADGEPIDRSPSHEGSTIRRRDSVAAHHAGPRVHRPAVPERVRAGAAAGGGRRVFLPQDTRRSSAVVSADGADHAAVRHRDQGLRRTQRHRHRGVRPGRAQRRPDAGVSAEVVRGRRRPLHRQGAGEGTRVAHRTPPRPGQRVQLSVAGLVDGDGEPVLTSTRSTTTSVRSF